MANTFSNWIYYYSRWENIDDQYFPEDFDHIYEYIYMSSICKHDIIQNKYTLNIWFNKNSSRSNYFIPRLFNDVLGYDRMNNSKQSFIVSNDSRHNLKNVNERTVRFINPVDYLYLAHMTNYFYRCGIVEDSYYKETLKHKNEFILSIYEEYPIHCLVKTKFYETFYR